VSDPRERELPDVGFVNFRDAETGEIIEVDTRHPRVRQLFQEQAAQRADDVSTGLRGAGVDELSVSTTESYATSLRRFFDTRERRSR